MLKLLNKLSGSHKMQLRNFGRKFGLEIKLNDVQNREDLRLAYFLRKLEIDLVLDVGANRGQFAEELFRAGYAGRIISFEALPLAHAALVQAAKSFGSRWTVAPRVALSDRVGQALFHVTAIDTSSSLYRSKESFASATPQARTVKSIEVPTTRLDTILDELGIEYNSSFLKLDVQGAESLVLAGAPSVLASARGVMSELSLAPLYEGQPPARDVLEAMNAAGFEVWDVWPGHRDRGSYRLNQVDLICFKPTGLLRVSEPSHAG
jgi:FkbM family methyltransferase